MALDFGDECPYILAAVWVLEGQRYIQVALRFCPHNQCVYTGQSACPLFRSEGQPQSVQTRMIDERLTLLPGIDILLLHPRT